MKRFTMILALVLMVAMPMMAERVTPETARKVAATFLSNNGAKSNQLTDLTETAGFSNLYIFNAEQGFVVMAADDCVQPILGYSLTGEFVAEDMPSNVSGWLQGYNDEIQYAIDSKMSATTETAKMWKDLAEGNSKAGKATVVVDALIQSTWDQDPGYNDLCPYDSNAGELTVTGCVATAMAQIMRYWEYPSHGTGSHTYNHSTYGTQSANFAQTTYDWSNMPLHSANGEIAKLMYHCGVSVDMDYGTNSVGGSSASTYDVVNALRIYFGYQQSNYKSKSSYNNNSWISLVKAELDNGRPLQYRGSGSGGGHSFVCDGYDNSNYFHFNWGWSGANDGFYSLNNLVPGSGGSGGGSYSFTQDQGAIFGIQPMPCTASAPTNLTVALESRTAVLTWDVANNAVAYSVYRDGLLIANTTNTTYPDANLSYGTYAYYVKSVDSNGAKSSPTAIVTVTIEPIPSNLTVTKNGNNAILNWIEPEWVAPSNDNEVLTYGDGNKDYSFGYGDGETCLYIGHKYPTSMLSANKVLYKVSFYAALSGNFTLFVYTSTSGSSRPQTTVLEQSINVVSGGWTDVEINDPIAIDETKDLWVFIYDPEAKDFPFAIGAYTENDNYGNYISYDPYTPTSALGTQSGYVVLIRTCITDGSFIYNLYDNNTSVASNLSGTSYTVTSITNNTAHQYTLKTNFGGGLTAASNMAGLALGNASLASLSLAANDMMTVTEGSVLTVSGSITNNGTAANLVLENGAQLSSSPVTGTMLKNINGYTDVHNDHEGYYLISSPVAGISPVNVTNMVSDTFDLYAFDATENQYWRNYKAQGNFTTLDQGIGYLYANADTTTLVFADTLNASFIAVNNLNYDANSTLHSLNLVGNPYAYQAEFNIADTYNGGWVSAPNCLTLNAAGDGFVVKPLVGDEIVLAPMEAVLVQATDYDESFTEHSDISPIGDGGEIKLAPGLINLSVSQDLGDVIDNAIVRFNGGSMLGKLRLNTHATELYIPQGGKDYSVVCAENEGTVPVNFKARQNGTYTLSIENQNLEPSYLHLIDNMTGADVDLLATPSYTFEATTDDHAYRFTLVLDESASDDATETAFAYYNGSEWVIDNIGKSTMEIVDMTGRVVVAKTIAGRQTEVLNLSSGIYVVRLNNGKTVKTQKIVVQ